MLYSIGFSAWPDMWNIFYDSLLRMGLPTGASHVGFATTWPSLWSNHTTENIERATKDALVIIDNWIRLNGFHLAHSKSKAVMLTRKWAFRTPRILCGSHKIEVKRVVKNLREILDSKQTFTPHLRAASAAADRAARAVGQFMPNVGGPSSPKRRLLTSVVNNRLLYVVPNWTSRALTFEVNRTFLVKAQRVATIRVSRCCQMVSVTAALLLAEVPPGDLLARERESARANKRADPEAQINPVLAATNARCQTVEECQAGWAAATRMAE